ncbi:hypothetical protein WU86_03975 [Corynebacterium xerosis]|nr:hypothetical protein WU86_03975 [Corynebacterium xerosis]
MSPIRIRPSRPAQWPTIIQQCGRSTARQSVMVFAFEGPTPMSMMVTPSPSSRTRWYAGICADDACARHSAGPGTSPMGKDTSPGQIRCVYGLCDVPPPATESSSTSVPASGPAASMKAGPSKSAADAGGTVPSSSESANDAAYSRNTSVCSW